MTQRLSQEFSLMVACCRWPHDPAVLSAIRAAAGAPIDWACFLRVVARHRVWGLVWDGLRQAQVAVPEDVRASLSAKAMAIAQENLRLSAESIRLMAGFDASALPVVFLKGITLGMLAYGGVAVKHGRDIDLLVSPDRMEAAGRFLETLGYRSDDVVWTMRERRRDRWADYVKHIGFFCAASKILIELHSCIDVNPYLKAWHGPLPPTQTVAVAGGTSVRTFGNDALLLYLGLHGAHHDWFRLKWLADFHALLKRCPEPDVERLYRDARSVNADAAFGCGLLLCAELFDYRLTPGLRETLCRSVRIRALRGFAYRMMTYADGIVDPDRTAFGYACIAVSHFFLGRDLPYFVRQIRIALFCQEDRFRLPLPRGLDFLYPLLRLPLWLVRKIRIMWALRAKK